MFKAVRLHSAGHAASFIVLLAAVGLLLAAPPARAQQQVVAGQNVNMVGGPWSYDPVTGRIVGDPFLQRQNEPSIALSSRNPCHILSGANDYRTVDVPGLPGDTETGDAWLGLMKSIDCGQTWTSTLLPGYPQDQSAVGLASPLKGLAAGADATVRPGPAGMFYYSGIAFNRGSSASGKVFVARLIDSNNKEQGDPFHYLGAVVIDTGTSGQFLDKPWIAADIPRGIATCTVNGETIPAGNVYLAYTSFTGGTNNPRSKIMFSTSSDCGASWSNPTKLSESVPLSQGTVVAINPVDGAIYVAWREFADKALNPDSPTTVGGILFARSTDGGKSFTKTAPIDSALHPFDQGSSAVSFRSNAYPTMAVDGTGRIYVAWAARGVASYRPDPVTGDARIVMSTSSDGGATWSMPRSVVDDQPFVGHQIMPALAFSAGKLVIAYYDFRDDAANVFGRYVDESLIGSGSGRRHTVELRTAMAEPSNSPVFTDYTSVDDSPSTPVSRYLLGSFGAGRPGLVPVQFNPPNLPIFALGTVPFIGDYIDIAGQTFTVNANREWRFNTEGDGSRIPLFHVAWTDNRDVRKPPIGQTWANYKSPTLGPTGAVCDPGSNPGSRNQNVYTAQLMPGLVVTAPGNHKTLLVPASADGRLFIQRAYVVFVRNTTSQDRSYRLSLAAPPSGSFASFRPIDESQLVSPQVPVVDNELGPILVPRRSSIARSVYIVSPTVAYPQVTVNVVESTAPGSLAASASVVLNPDIANPDIANPDIANPDIANPDIANAEVYNPDIANPDIANPDIANPDIANPDIANPDIANPDIANPDIANPDIANPDIANPDIANPDIANPDIANPDIANPDIANSPPLDSFKVTDITWPVTNKGNTTAAYAFRAALKRSLPAGAKLQLIVRRVYIAPQANFQNTCGTALLPTIQSQVLVNIPNPELSSSLSTTFDPDQFADNASFFLQPADQGLVTLRVFCPTSAGTACPTLQQAVSLASARVESQAPNNCPPGVTNGNCAVSDFNPDDIYDAADAEAPAVTLVGSPTMTIESDSAFVDPGATALDAVDGAVAVVVTGAVQTGVLGTYTLAYTATDSSGNSAFVTRTVTVVDTTAPIVTVPANIVAEATSGGGAVVTFAASAIDGVDGLVATTCAPASGSTFALGAPTTVTCSATDAAGKTGTGTFTVTIADTIAPIVTVPANITAEATSGAGASVSFTASASDIVSGSVTTTCAPASGSTFALGAPTTVTCSATDTAGKTGTGTFTVTIADTIAPIVTVPANITAEATSGAGAIVSFTASASDIVSGSVTTTCSPTSGSTFALGTRTVICSATDAAGKTGTASFTVTVGDTIAPVVTVPANITAEATSGAGAIVSFTASASDIVSGSVTTTCAPASGSTFALGSRTVICSATDTAGKTGTASFTVTVRDTVAPTLTVPANITAEATGPTGRVVTYSATATDAVTASIVPVCTPASGATFAIGTTNVGCTATDGAGKTTSKSFTVTVRDTVVPALTVSVNPTLIWSPNGAMVPVTLSGVVTDSGSGPGTVRYSVKDEYGTIQPSAGPVATNGDGSYSFSVSLQASRKGSDKNGRTYTFTVTATDKAGNSATKVLAVTAVEHNQ